MIIYLHRITDNRIYGSPPQHLQTFMSLCGQRTMPNVVIATTMWGHVGQENGERREAELKNGFCSEMGADAYRVERFQDTYESAWLVVGQSSLERIIM